MSKKISIDDARYRRLVTSGVVTRSSVIKAAPEMLEALEHCLAYFNSKKPTGCGVNDERDCSPFNDALQAIKKAKGKV